MLHFAKTKQKNSHMGKKTNMPNPSFTKNEMIPMIHCVGALDAVIDRPPHTSPQRVDVTCARSGAAGVATRLHTSTLTPCDDVIKGHSQGVAHLIQ